VDIQTEPDVQLLVDRMRAGDREAAAEFLERFGPRIRRRVRGKLPVHMRRLIDSQEILSTLGRRLDRFVASGRVRANTTGELWSLVFRMTDNSLIEKARLFRSLETREGEDGEFAQRVLGRLREVERGDLDAPLIEIDAALRSLGPGVERQITTMWLNGHTFAEIGAELGMKEATARKRWESIRHRLRDLFESGGC
jgi:DNA-directed RNA polymerase specialized sigma24 family protein